ncbi:MAG: hypothetical protein KJO08_01480 [Gammaproteobacteria bacterium]|nr:hypothetical protein [Gammaproteobacteria bacterium]
MVAIHGTGSRQSLGIWSPSLALGPANPWRDDGGLVNMAFTEEPIRKPRQKHALSFRQGMSETSARDG